MKPITKRRLPEPEGTYGYTIQQLKKFFTKKQMKQFNKNFGTQTCTLDFIGRLNYYPCDVYRAIEGYDPLD